MNDALAELQSSCMNGGEFPDEDDRIARKYGVDVDELEQAYGDFDSRR